MIATVLRISLLRLLHNRPELVLTFVVPVLFFSVFALIFGHRDAGGSARLRIAFVDEPQTAQSRRWMEKILESKAVRPVPGVDPAAGQAEGLPILSSAEAAQWIRLGRADAIFRIGIQPESASGAALRVQVLTDSFDPITSNIAAALAQSSLMELMSLGTTDSVRGMAPSSLAIEGGRAENLLEGAPVSGPSDGSVGTASLAVWSAPSGSVSARFSDHGTGSNGVPSEGTSLATHLQEQGTALQSDPAALAIASNLPMPDGRQMDRWPNGLGTESNSLPSVAMSLPEVEVVDVLGNGKANPIVAMYAAGIAVMFLLFSATAGSGALLEEREQGTLDRLLGSRMTIDQLLLGKWLFLMGLGLLQTTVMFAWGQCVFGVDLVGHWDGFLAMTTVTAGAAASLALLLATLCHSRNQLNWISVVLILSMSALGGSMVPRYVMSQTMREIGMVTFNAWALEGYNKVFWRDLPVSQLGMELAVLTASGFLMLLAARLAAQRWERS
ncbi:MAG: ABC transporter permease [Pirellulaceae bacterium]|jgi:ABC-2 type transport system permease protein